MTGGYVLADERDVRTVGTLVRRERAAGGVELTRAYAQDSSPIGGPTSAATGFFTKRTRGFSGLNPIGYAGGESVYGIRLEPGKKIKGTLVVAGRASLIANLTGGTWFGANISAQCMITVEKTGSGTIYDSFRYSFTASSPWVPHVFDVGFTYVGTLSIAGLYYDELLSSGEGVIVNNTASDVLVYVRVWEPPDSSFILSVDEAMSVIWNYTIF